MNQLVRDLNTPLLQLTEMLVEAKLKLAASQDLEMRQKRDLRRCTLDRELAEERVRTPNVSH